MPILIDLPSAYASYMDIGRSEGRIRLAFRATGHHDTLVDLTLDEARRLADTIHEELAAAR